MLLAGIVAGCSGDAGSVGEPVASEQNGNAATNMAAGAGITPTTITSAPVEERTAAATPPKTDSWTVVHIVDGDTVDVVSPSGIEERVRVIGIDTPENGACGFDEAADALARLVADRHVTLVAGARDDRDHYGRLLRYLDVGTVDAGFELIIAGHAIARYDSRDGYGRHPREDAYVAADAGSIDLCDSPAPAVAPVVGLAPAAAPLAPTPTVQVFRNCAELNAVYPGGVARAGVTANTVSGTPRPFRIQPHHDDALYAANESRDGDDDGIACEK